MIANMTTSVDNQLKSFLGNDNNVDRTGEEDGCGQLTPTSNDDDGADGDGDDDDGGGGGDYSFSDTCLIDNHVFLRFG